MQPLSVAAWMLGDVPYPIPGHLKFLALMTGTPYDQLKSC